MSRSHKEGYATGLWCATISACRHLWFYSIHGEGYLVLIMKIYVILNDMIIEDERDSYGLTFDYECVEGSTPVPNLQWDHHLCYETYFHGIAQVQDP